MIIFYNKKTGAIIGTIDGRIHSKIQLGMWIGSKEENDRIVIQWKQTQRTAGFVEYTPDHPQKEIFVAFEKKQDKPQNYKVDINTKALIKK